VILFQTITPRSSTTSRAAGSLPALLQPPSRAGSLLQGLPAAFPAPGSTTPALTACPHGELLQPPHHLHGPLLTHLEQVRVFLMLGLHQPPPIPELLAELGPAGGRNWDQQGESPAQDAAGCTIPRSPALGCVRGAWRWPRHPRLRHSTTCVRCGHWHGHLVMRSGGKQSRRARDQPAQRSWLPSLATSFSPAPNNKRIEVRCQIPPGD